VPWKRHEGIVSLWAIRPAALMAFAELADTCGIASHAGVGGFMAFGETESEVEQSLDGLRRAISFYGSTRSYHHIFEAHGFDSLGMQLHELSLKGEWDKMADAVNFEVAAEMAHATTWDDLPKYVNNNLSYASRIGLGGLQAVEGHQIRMAVRGYIYKLGNEVHLFQWRIRAEEQRH